MALGGALASLACGYRHSRVALPAPDHPPEFAELIGACHGAVAPGPADWARRRAQVQAKMEAAGIALAVYEPGPAMAYLIGMAGHRSERPWVLGLPVTGEPLLLCPAFEQRSAQERVVGQAELVAWREHEDPFARLGDAFGGVGGGRVAIDPSMRSFVAAGIARAFGGVDTRADDPVGLARRCKQPEEIALLRIANLATKRAIAAVAARVVVGTRQSEIAAWMKQSLVAAGMGDPWALALVGPNASFPHGTAQDRAVRPGDVVLVDTGASLHGYQSDITRTWCVGDPSLRTRAVWDTVARAQQAAHAALGPGAIAGSVDASARRHIAEAGFGPDDRFFTHRLGHGIGLEVHEPPYLVSRSPVELAVGNTMSNEPGIYIPGELGVRLEDIVLITESGAEVFGAYAPALDRPFAE